jgi:molecular chaperone DnaK (HSP70)
MLKEPTIEAGEIAGLKVERIINEPTAAALHMDLIRR